MPKYTATLEIRDGNEVLIHADMRDFPPEQLRNVVEGIVSASLTAVEKGATKPGIGSVSPFDAV